MPVIPPYLQQEIPAVTPAPTPTSPDINASTRPVRRHKFSPPKLRVHLNEIAHDGSSIFLSNVKGNEDLEAQVQNVLNLLYMPDSARPGTRSVTFVLRPMDGVAYTTGTELDSDHKEIHINLKYIAQVAAGRNASPRDEILGVICHELVHCFQWAAGGSCPGGLIEGVADWVRLRAGLAAKHWRQEADGAWDGGYQHTGYFLEYLEGRFGEGTVKNLNAGLRVGKYNEEKLFGECCQGHKVKDLWKDYGESLKKKKKTDEDTGKDDKEVPPNPVPTHGALPLQSRASQSQGQGQ